MADRVVVFGGTFDPIHFGHLIVARAAAEQLGLQRITLMPAASAPHKATGGPGPAPFPAAAEHRLAMIRLAIEGDSLFEVSELELNRKGASFTIDTLSELRRLHGPTTELCWIIGADMLDDLPNWRRAEEVVATARMVTVVRRPQTDQLSDTLAKLGSRFPPEQVERLRAGILPTPAIDISSSDIRQRVRAGKPVNYLTDVRVISYIRRHGLYLR